MLLDTDIQMFQPIVKLRQLSSILWPILWRFELDTLHIF